MLLQSPYFEDNYSILNAEKYAKRLNDQQYKNIENLNNAVPVENCECYYSLSCPGQSNSCEDDKGKCSHTRDGCGIFGTAHCTGRCSFSPA